MVDKMKIIENENAKKIKSRNFNLIFDKRNGHTITWGKTLDDDPEFCPYGPIILDFEITTKCHGVTGNGDIKKVCDFCYKSNTPYGSNTSFKDFKIVFDKLPKTLTQIAFGVDASATSNPDIFKMMHYARDNGVIPNLTIADISEETAEKLAEVCGAVAVSRYANKQLCYDNIKMLSNKGIEQTNMHILVSKQTKSWIWETFHDYLENKIPGLNAIVLLGLKKRGRGEHFDILSFDEYKDLIEFALENNIPFGADSCSGSKLIKSVKHSSDYNEIFKSVDPCESFRMSLYVDEQCRAYPCSFSPDSKEWISEINMLTVKDFQKEVWNSNMAKNFRNQLRNAKDENGCEQCPIYNI